MWLTSMLVEEVLFLFLVGLENLLIIYTFAPVWNNHFGCVYGPESMLLNWKQCWNFCAWAAGANRLAEAEETEVSPTLKSVMLWAGARISLSSNLGYPEIVCYITHFQETQLCLCYLRMGDANSDLKKCLGTAIKYV